MKKVLAGIVAGLLVRRSIVRDRRVLPPYQPHTRLVAEDASARAEAGRDPLRALCGSRRDCRVWKQLFAVLPANIEVYVEVAQRATSIAWSRSSARPPHLERLHPVVVGAPITTWSRDRYAVARRRRRQRRDPRAAAHRVAVRRPRRRCALAGRDLARDLSPRPADRRHRVRRRRPRGDAELRVRRRQPRGRNLGRAQADAPAIERELHARFAQDLDLARRRRSATCRATTS